MLYISIIWLIKCQSNNVLSCSKEIKNLKKDLEEVHVELDAFYEKDKTSLTPRQPTPRRRSAAPHRNRHVLLFYNDLFLLLFPCCRGEAGRSLPSCTTGIVTFFHRSLLAFSLYFFLHIFIFLMLSVWNLQKFAQTTSFQMLVNIWIN